MTKLARFVAVFGLFALIAAGCAESSEEGASPTGAAKPGVGMSGCEVTDTGGIDDKSFNATAYKGLTDAEADLGIKSSYLESQTQQDYTPNIRAFLGKCDLIVTVGFFLGDATAAAAKANADQKFAIVDFAYDPPIKNVLGLTFQTDQAAFLAGYLAAGMTKSGKIGTFGGANIPTVTIFMNGLAAGIRGPDLGGCGHHPAGCRPGRSRGCRGGAGRRWRQSDLGRRRRLRLGPRVLQPVSHEHREAHGCRHP